MATNDFMSHTGSNGSSMGQRVDATGYAWSALAENIAGGQSSVNAVMSAWMSSSGHCHNIMNPSLQHIGAACMQNPDAQYTRYWTMVLGRPR